MWAPWEGLISFALFIVQRHCVVLNWYPLLVSLYHWRKKSIHRVCEIHSLHHQILLYANHHNLLRTLKCTIFNHTHIGKHIKAHIPTDHTVVPKTNRSKQVLVHIFTDSTYTQTTLCNSFIPRALLLEWRLEIHLPSGGVEDSESETIEVGVNVGVGVCRWLFGKQNRHSNANLCGGNCNSSFFSFNESFLRKLFVFSLFRFGRNLRTSEWQWILWNTDQDC